jgi:hypothetical protein
VNLGGFIWQQSSSLAFAIKASGEERITDMDYADKWLNGIEARISQPFAMFLALFTIVIAANVFVISMNTALPDSNAVLFAAKVMLFGLDAVLSVISAVLLALHAV